MPGALPGYRIGFIFAAPGAVNVAATAKRLAMS